MKGKPWLGMISGFFFGIFGGITLFLYGVIPLDSPLLWILPIVGIVFGLFMATWAPFGKGVQATGPPPSETGPGGELINHNPPIEDSSDE